MRVLLSRDDNAPAVGFLQSRFWADFKAESGWSFARYVVSVYGDASQGDETAFGTVETFALSVLERGLGFGLRFAYVPHGPESRIPACDRAALLVAIAAELKPRVSRSCLFVRFDPAWYELEPALTRDGEAKSAVGDSGSADDAIASAGALAAPARPTFGQPLRKASDVQPPDSVVLDIARTDDEILAGMKPKWRYNVRLAEKKGVSVASEGLAGLDDFYALYMTTAARDTIAIHPRSYYERLWNIEAANAAEPQPVISLWIARYEGAALAAIITVFYGIEATYLYGASSDEHRNLMPAYALQWAAIREAREAGCGSYDFYGIPPVDDPHHAMSGLYRFKTGFGGEIRHYAGSWDYVLRPATYAAFRAAERARLFWHKTVKKKIGR